MSEKYHFELGDISMDELHQICGTNDAYLQILRDLFACEITLRDGELIVIGTSNEVGEQIQETIRALCDMLRHDIAVNERDVIYCATLAMRGQLDRLCTTYQKAVGRTMSGKLIYPKTMGQRYLCSCMEKEPIVFATGVAGTGKTYLAVVYAATLLKKGEISKIILTRPAVEAGENLGFLPGDLKEKVDPYLRPLYDALNDVLGNEGVERLIEKEVIEIAPLAYMRGRTLDNAFIILDEAQNTTRAQMKMFLTRMGFQSKIVITGDITQIDLIKKKDSGLMDAKTILEGIKGIAFAELTSLDVVRNPLVQKIIERYESRENECQ